MILAEVKGRRWPIYAAVLILFLVVAYFAWQHLHPAQPVTPMSQDKAETADGVALAAANAHVKMLQGQLEDAAKEIAKLKDKPPDVVVQTVPVEVPKIVEAERKKSGADFAIVTNPKETDKAVDLQQISKLPDSTPVTLNQYNVFAYKKIIRGVNVYPDWGELGQRKLKLNELSVDWSKRITNDGKYLGITGAYNFDREQAKVGLRYSF